MEIEVVLLVIVAAIAASIVLGGSMTGLFTASFSPSHAGDDSQVSGDDAQGFDISDIDFDEVKTAGTKSSKKSVPDNQDTALEEGGDDILQSIIGFFGGGSKRSGTGGGDPDDKKGDDPVDEPPVEEDETPEASVSFDVPEIVEENEIFSVTVEIDTDANVFGIDLELEYDNSILRATDITVGDFFQSDMDPTKLEFDNDNGLVKYVAINIDTGSDSQTGVSGSGSVLTVEFETIGEGTSPLNLEVKIIDDKRSDVWVTLEDSEVHVS